MFAGSKCNLFVIYVAHFSGSIFFSSLPTFFFSCFAHICFVLKSSESKRYNQLAPPFFVVLFLIHHFTVSNYFSALPPFLFYLYILKYTFKMSSLNEILYIPHIIPTMSCYISFIVAMDLRK